MSLNSRSDKDKKVLQSVKTTKTKSEGLVLSEF